MDRTEQLTYLKQLSEQLKYGFTGMFNPNRKNNLEYGCNTTNTGTRTETDSATSIDSLQREDGFSPE